jgi:hypothetical protein
MSEPIATTRIADLPENITIQMNGQYQQQQPTQYALPNVPQGPPPPIVMGSNAQQQVDVGQNTYVPINIHPNPYGVQQQDPTLPLPQNIQQRGTNQVPPQNYSAQIMGGLDPAQEIQHRLPSRDIPMDSLAYQHDQEIQPNYIPKPKLTSDYIRDYEAASEDRLRKHEEKKHRERTVDSIFTNIQTPILIAILYFLFQLPIVTTLLYKYFSFLAIYNADGNLNLSGLILKSVMFGSLFFSLQSISEYVSSF